MRSATFMIELKRVYVRFVTVTGAFMLRIMLCVILYVGIAFMLWYLI